MIVKTHNTHVRLSIGTCHKLLRNIGNGIPNWIIIPSRSNESTLIWRLNEVFITASLTSLSNNETDVVISVEAPRALMDLFGGMDKALQNIVVPFEAQATTLQQASLLEQIQEGLLCPTCGKQLPSGAKFCPYDGTSIGRECPTCKHTNAPNASFCSNCGTAF